MSKTRGWLYKAGRVLGDFEALKKGKIGRRLLRRGVGKMSGRGIGKIFRSK